MYSVWLRCSCIVGKDVWWNHNKLYEKSTSCLVICCTHYNNRYWRGAATWMKKRYLLLCPSPRNEFNTMTAMILIIEYVVAFQFNAKFIVVKLLWMCLRRSSTWWSGSPSPALVASWSPTSHVKSTPPSPRRSPNGNDHQVRSLWMLPAVLGTPTQLSGDFLKEHQIHRRMYYLNFNFI